MANDNKDAVPAGIENAGTAPASNANKSRKPVQDDAVVEIDSSIKEQLGHIGATEEEISAIPGFAKFHKEANSHGIAFVSVERLKEKAKSLRRDTIIYGAIVAAFILVLIGNAMQNNALVEKNTTLKSELASMNANYSQLLETDKQLQSENGVLKTRQEGAKKVISNAFDILNGKYDAVVTQ